MVSEAVNMTATATPKIMAIYQEQHEAECGHQHQVNEVTSADDNGRARNNNCWKCGDTSHFARSVLGILQKEINPNQIQWLQMQKLISLGLYQ